MIVCYRCGCTDDQACPGGCYWTRVSTKAVEYRGQMFASGDLGICSRCDDGAPLDGFTDLALLEEWIDDGADDDLAPLGFEDSPLILPGDPEFLP